ncbi:MAG: hypothetical protein K6B74_03690 [Ruminococcus sp.]|nr:hypothetical protein [Ruminococcus sp.]
MAEDKERRLSLGKDNAEKKDDLDVSPVISNIMEYMGESSEDSWKKTKNKISELFFGDEKHRGSGSDSEKTADDSADHVPDSSPLIGGGTSDDDGGYSAFMDNSRSESAAAQDHTPDSSPLIGGGLSENAREYEEPKETAEDFAPESYSRSEEEILPDYGETSHYYDEPQGNSPIIGGDVYEDGLSDIGENTAEPSYQQSGVIERDAEQGDYIPDKTNHGACFTMRTLDDDDRSKAATVQPEYIGEENKSKIAAGIAKLKTNMTVRAAALFFAAVFSVFITSANDLGLPLAAVFDRTVNPSAYLFTNTILGILSVGFAYSMVINGLKNFIKLKPDSDSLAAINLVAACISGLVTLFDPESLKASFFHLYTSAAILGMFLNTLAKLSVATRAQRNFEFMESTENIYAIRHEDESVTSSLTNNHNNSIGEIALMRKTGFVRDFIKNSYSYDLADLFAEKTAPIIMGIAIAAGVLSLIFDDHAAAMQEKLFVFLASVSGSLSLCSSFALATVVNMPLAEAGRKVTKKKGALLGYSSVEEFAGCDNVLFDASQLFPRNCLHLTNMKMLVATEVEYAVRYAASLARAGELFSYPAFEKLLGGKTDGFYAVKGLANEDGEGISATIAGRKMLLGSRELMKRSQIEGLPPIAAEENFAADGCVIYLAVSGRAAAMFVLTLTADEDTGAAMRALVSGGVEVYIRCPDGILTRDYIATLYNAKADKIHILRPDAEGDTSWIHEPAESLSASMFCSGSISGFAMLIAEARRVRTAANIGIALQYGQVILGGLISVLLMLSGKFGIVTPTVTMAFGCSFLALTLLIQKLKS